MDSRTRAGSGYVPALTVHRKRKNTFKYKGYAQLICLGKQGSSGVSPMFHTGSAWGGMVRRKGGCESETVYVPGGLENQEIGKL